MAKMQRVAFSEALQKHVFEIMLKCHDKAFQLEYRKRHCDTRLVVNDGRLKYVIDAGICEIKFSVTRFSDYKTQELIYYKWSDDDNHHHVVDDFGEHLKQFYARMFPMDYSVDFVFPFSAWSDTCVV